MYIVRATWINVFKASHLLTSTILLHLNVLLAARSYPNVFVSCRVGSRNYTGTVVGMSHHSVEDIKLVWGTLMMPQKQAGR